MSGDNAIILKWIKYTLSLELIRWLLIQTKLFKLEQAYIKSCDANIYQI